MKSTEGGQNGKSPVKENAATLIVCPVSVLSNWTVSMVYLYFFVSEPSSNAGRDIQVGRGTCDRVRTWSGFYSIMPVFHSRVRSFLDFNCDAIVDLWIFIISLAHRTRYGGMSIKMHMSVCKFTCIMDNTVGGMWSF